MPNSNTTTIWTPIIFEWYVVMCGSKTDTQKMCPKEIGLCTQHMLTKSGLIVNMIGGGGGTYMTTEPEDLHFDNKEDALMSSEIYEENSYMHDLWIC